MPIELLENAGIEYLINPFNIKITEEQLADFVTDFDVIIAGTEPITEKVFNKASHLKFISPFVLNNVEMMIFVDGLEKIILFQIIISNKYLNIL